MNDPMDSSRNKPKIIILPGSSLPSQPWWPGLHTNIIEAFLNKNYSVFPPTWTRLNTDPAKGGEGLAQELGDNGHMAVLFSEGDQPVACGGVLPFRGEHWINDAGKMSDAEIANLATANSGSSVVDWEICCFCVHPSARGRGYSRQLLEVLITFVKPKGAKRLLGNYAIDETSAFWQNLGFQVIPGAGGMLPKGFQADAEKEGLRADIHFHMGALSI